MFFFLLLYLFLLPERRYVDLVVLEVFQVKSFNIKGGECVVVPAFWDIAFVILSKDIFSCIFFISGWRFCSLMIVHLKLQDDSEEYVDVVRMGVHDYVEDAFLLDLPEVIDS